MQSQRKGEGHQKTNITGESKGEEQIDDIRESRDERENDIIGESTDERELDTNGKKDEDIKAKLIRMMGHLDVMEKKLDSMKGQPD